MKEIELYNKGHITAMEAVYRLLCRPYYEVWKVLNDLPPEVFKVLKDFINQHGSHSKDIRVFHMGAFTGSSRHHNETFLKGNIILLAKLFCKIEGHIDDGGFMYGTCSRCGEFLG